VAVTLPDDVVGRLRAIDVDLGWAIVRLLDETSPGVDDLPNLEARVALQSPMELVRLRENQHLILVSAAAISMLPLQSLVPLSDGRAFIAFDGDGGIADLELTLVDRLDALSPGSHDHAMVATMREQLRSWRRDSGLSFRRRSIIVAETKSTDPVRRLPAIASQPPERSSTSARKKK
jgi:hypothetical protein